MKTNRRVVHVPTSERTYNVYVGQGTLAEVGGIVRDFCGEVSYCIVTDSNVGPLYADTVRASIEAEGMSCGVVTFPAGEQNKNMSTLAGILEQVAELGLTRDDCIVALGGGVAGDMGGLAAALYLRGIKVVQVPTSLLAMVDSSVGGKTAVDLEAGKNLAGAFLQPRAVVADVDTLSTVPPELLTDSCGEVIKHAVMADEMLFQVLTAVPINSPNFPRQAFMDIVLRNVGIKRDVVARDEHEAGERQKLNLGHTIGHAIEAASGFELGHGASVAAGLCCMARAAVAKGWTNPEVARAIEECVADYGLPVDTNVPHDELMGYLMHDKKRHAEGFNIVVPVKIGQVELKRVSVEEMRELIDAGCGTFGA